MHRRLFEALGATPPEFVHHGLILGDDGRKLSKRAEGATVASLREAGIPAEAVRAYLEELGVPKHDVRLDLPRVRRLSIEALGALSDEELAARVGVPVSVAPVLRGARDLVEAREYATLVLEPQPADVDAPETLERFRELVEAGHRAEGRRPGAEGGRRRPEGAAPRADGRRARPRACGGDRGAAAGRAAAPDRRLERCASTTRTPASSSSCRRRPARSACTRAARPSTSAIHVGNALAVRDRAVAASAGCEHRGYEVTLVVNITDINDKIYDAAPGRSAELARRRDRAGTSRTPSGSGSAVPDVEPTAAETIPSRS